MEELDERNKIKNCPISNFVKEDLRTRFLSGRFIDIQQSQTQVLALRISLSRSSSDILHPTILFPRISKRMLPRTKQKEEMKKTKNERTSTTTTTTMMKKKKKKKMEEKNWQKKRASGKNLSGQRTSRTISFNAKRQPAAAVRAFTSKLSKSGHCSPWKLLQSLLRRLFALVIRCWMTENYVAEESSKKWRPFNDHQRKKSPVLSLSMDTRKSSRNCLFAGANLLEEQKKEEAREKRVKQGGRRKERGGKKRRRKNEIVSGGKRKKKPENRLHSRKGLSTFSHDTICCRHLTDNASAGAKYVFQLCLLLFPFRSFYSFLSRSFFLVTASFYVHGNCQTIRGIPRCTTMQLPVP